MWMLLPNFLKISTCMEYLFPFSHFYLFCVFSSEVNLFFVAYRCIFVYLVTLCILIGAFSPLAFKLIIVKYNFIAILNLAFQWFCVSLCSFLLVFHFVVWWFSFVLCCATFFVCESIICFWNVISLFFKYINPLLCLLAFDS